MKKAYKILLIVIAILLFLQTINWLLSSKAEEIVKSQSPSFGNNSKILPLPIGYYVKVEGQGYGASCDICDDMVWRTWKYNLFLIGGLGLYKAVEY